MKRLTLAAVVFVGLFVTSNSTQAQFPRYGRTYNTVPSYTAPSYSYSINRYSNYSFSRFGSPSFNGFGTVPFSGPSFSRFNYAPFGYQGAGAPAVPMYNGVNGIGSYTPLGGTTIVTGGSSFRPYASQRFNRR